MRACRLIPALASPVAQVCRSWWQVTTSACPSGPRSPAVSAAASSPLRRRVAPRRRPWAVNRKSVSAPVRGCGIGRCVPRC
jgi:hypothetical protein